MIDQSAIERIVRDQGLTVQFRSYVSRRSDGTETTYVYVGLRGGLRSLGRVEKVMELSETELELRLAALTKRGKRKVDV